MERIIKAIEEKLESQERTIYLQQHEIKELKRKLDEAQETIEQQGHIIGRIDDLKGANA